MSAARQVGRGAEYGFAELVRTRFGFLERAGLSMAQVSDDLVRFESAERFVNVYFGGNDYQAGVDVGRWVDLDGERREEEFPMVHLLAVQRGERQLDRIRSATSREQLERELVRLADLLEPEVPAIVSDPELFDRMGELNTVLSARFLDSGQAARLRERADAAWHRRDLPEVVLAYEQIESELSTVRLSASERARLDYARRHLG